MRVIRPSRIREFIERHRDAESSLIGWLTTAESADWNSIEDVRQAYPHADATVVASGRTVIIFNIRGNRYRLIVAIHFSTRIVFVRDFLTHSEYSKDRWKERH